MGRGERIIVSGLLILTLLLSTIPLTSASESKSERDYVTYTTTENYSLGNFNLEISDNNPPDSSNGSDSGTLTREWVENTYEKVVIENFPATRRVIDHYAYEPSYRVGSDTTDLWRVDEVTYEEYQHLSQVKDEGWWKNKLGIRDYSVKPNRFQDFEYGFNHFQGFSLWNNWKWVEVEFYLPQPIWAPNQFHFLYEWGSYKIPVYKEEEYTRWRTTTYQINDWTPDNWPAINAQITLTGVDGYDGDVQLSVTTDTELLDASLENQVVHVESTATTNLTIQPQRELSGSIHTITVTATDDYSRTKQAAYSLELQTSEKPPVENAILSIEETDIKPSDPTKPPTYKPESRLGVEGSVYDAQTKKGVCSGLSVTVDGRSAKVWGNNYRDIYIIDDFSFDGHTFSITAKADDYVRRTVTAFDYEGDYKLAHKNIYLQPEGEAGV